MQENEIQHDLLAIIGAVPGVMAFRVNVIVAGRCRSVPDGTPDVYIQMGRAVWLECKTPEVAALLDRRGPRSKTEIAQAAWKHAHDAAGGLTLRCSDVRATVRQLADLATFQVRNDLLASLAAWAAEQ